jgi:hypothetical protein
MKFSSTRNSFSQKPEKFISNFGNVAMYYAALTIKAGHLERKYRPATQFVSQNGI